MFYLTGKHSVKNELRHVSRVQVEKMLAVLESDGSEAEKIHLMRVACKRMRSLLRLIRPGMPNYSRENAEFRGIASSLSQSRDARVLLQGCRRLADCFPSSSLAEMIMSLEKTAALAEAADIQSSQLRAQLQAVIKRIDEWKIKGKEFETISQGFRITYEQGRQGLIESLKTHDAEVYHDWRKPVKYHYYHLKLLRKVCPHNFQIAAKRAKKLGRLLGEEHDIYLLRNSLKDEHRLPPIDRIRAHELTGDWLADLRKHILHSGAVLYEVPPEKFLQSLEKNWKKWK